MQLVGQVANRLPASFWVFGRRFPTNRSRTASATAREIKGAAPRCCIPPSVFFILLIYSFSCFLFLWGHATHRPTARTVPILRDQELSSLSPEFPGISNFPEFRISEFPEFPLRNDRSSRSTNRGTGRSRQRCLSRKVSSCGATTP